MKKLKSISNPIIDGQIKYVAFIFGSNTAIEMLFSIAQTTSEKLFVYSPKFTEHQKKLMKKLNIKFSSSTIFVKLNLASFKIVITMGFLPHIAHRPVIEICSLYKRIGGVIIDFQHGLFQWGINFSDSSIEQGYDQRDDIGISLPIESFADKTILWFGENGVGYPKTLLNRTNVSDENYILIVSNTNWHIYSNEEKVRFAYFLGRYIKRNPDKKFIWKPHPAEFNAKLSPVMGLINDYKFNNLTTINHGEKGKSVVDLIEQCSWGITTIGTSVLDFKIYQKPCLIYSTTSCSNLLSELNQCTTFSRQEDMYKSPCIPLLNEFKDFDAKQFWNNVKSSYINLKYSDTLAFMSDAFRN